MNEDNRRLGEVIESDTTRFVAEADTLHTGPMFGSLVQVTEPEKPTIIGLIFNVTTGSLSPGRKALARGRPPDRYDAQIYDDFPELKETLRTEFSALVVGYQTADGRYVQAIPPYPASIHYSVYPCPFESWYTFTSRFAFLRTILTAQDLATDGLIAATILGAAELRNGATDDFLLLAGKEVAALLADDYDRLVGILRLIAPNERAVV